MHRSTALTLLPAALLLASAPLAQSAWVVGSADPNADFAALQPAIDAAASGDVIVVRSGAYGNFVIDGKSLAIVADEGATASLFGSQSDPQFVLVRNLAADQTVVLRGLDVVSQQVFFDTVGVRIADNAGTVWLEDVDVEMFNPFSTGFDVVHALRVERSDSVVLVGGTLRGHRASEALSIEDSEVYVYGGSYTGGPGTSESPGTVQFDGGHGARLDGGTLFASGASFRGGAGADAVILFCDLPSAGGSGVAVVDGTLRDLDLQLRGGPGGSGLPCGIPNGPKGATVQVVGGARTPIAGSARSLTASSPVYVGETLTQTFAGAPGEVVYSLAAFVTAPAVFVPEYAGAGVFAPPFLFTLHGFTDGAGALVETTPIPDLGYEALTAYFQPIFIDPVTLEIRVGAFSQTSILAAALAP